MKYTVKEFANEIRTLYPGDYDDLSDQELVEKWLRKYPGDKEKVHFTDPNESEIKFKPKENEPYMKARTSEERQHVENRYEGLSDELSKSVHKSKTYTTQAIIALVLYYVGFFIVGFIVNLIYLSSANDNRRRTGYDPPGRGCLVTLLWFHIVLAIVVLVILIATGVFVSNQIDY